MVEAGQELGNVDAFYEQVGELQAAAYFPVSNHVQGEKQKPIENDGRTL